MLILSSRRINPDTKSLCRLCAHNNKIQSFSEYLNVQLKIFIISVRLTLTGMQNLSISCALVCLIILGSAALIGAFGVCQRQISAILVTGVMYLLAGS